MTNPHGSFIWYELMTADPAASKAFYDAVCHWTIDADPAPGAVEYRMINAGDGAVGGVFRLTEDMTAQGATPRWVGYVGVGDVDAVTDQAKALGATLFVPPTDIPGVGRFSLLADPQGAPFYLMRGDGDHTSTAFDEKAMGHISWNELKTSDPAGALAFFGAIASWANPETLPMGEMGDYHLVNVGDRRIGAVMGCPPGMPPHWTFYIRVDEIGAANDRLVAAGGTVMHGPAEVPGGDWIILATDPHGVPFGLVGPYENDVE